MCSFWLCESIVANPIIYRLVPRPPRFEIRQFLDSLRQWRESLGTTDSELIVESSLILLAQLFHGEGIFTCLFGFLPLFEFLIFQLFMPDSLSHLSHVFEKWKAWDFSRDPKSSWKCGGHRFWELTVVARSSYRVIWGQFRGKWKRWNFSILCGY